MNAQDRDALREESDGALEMLRRGISLPNGRGPETPEEVYLVLQYERVADRAAPVQAAHEKARQESARRDRERLLGSAVVRHRLTGVVHLAGDFHEDFTHHVRAALCGASGVSASRLDGYPSLEAALAAGTSRVCLTCAKHRAKAQTETFEDVVAPVEVADGRSLTEPGRSECEAAYQQHPGFYIAVAEAAHAKMRRDKPPVRSARALLVALIRDELYLARADRRTRGVTA